MTSQRILTALLRRPVRSDWLIIALTAAAAAFVALACAQTLLVSYQQAKLDAYADAIIVHVDQVSEDIVRVLDTAHAMSVPRCSDEDIRAMRALVIRARFVRDIARMQDRQILCSAVWGRLAQPYDLGEPSGHPIGLPVWLDHPTPGDPGVTANLTGRDDTVVTNAPTALEAIKLLHREGVSATLNSLSGTRVLGRFGDGQESADDLLTPRPGRDALVAQPCSSRYDLCVSAHRERPWLPTHWPSLAAAVTVLGALAGALIGILLVAFQARRTSLPTQLRRALRQTHPRGLSLRYQPLYRLSDGQLHGVEALARWSDERNRIISPETFVPMIETLGLSTRFDRHVVTIALAEMEERLCEPEHAFSLSINVSAESLLDTSFHRFLQDQATQRHIDTGRIILEITERTTVARPDLIQATHALRNLGFNIHIDDFGTGYSSLSYLTELSIDAIKIDQSFIHAIGTGSAKESVVDAICHLARKLQVGIIAEGVEQQEQADRVLTLASDALAQGWLFGRPLTIAELPR